MNLTKTLFAVFLMGSLISGCTEPDTYPVSGEECGPSDPVKDMQAVDCVPTL